MNQNIKVKYFLKKDSDLSVVEKRKMQELMIAVYPKFKKVYLKNGYYSTVRPQMQMLAKVNQELVATGKLLWRKAKINNCLITFFAFGVLVAKEYRNNGIGENLIKLSLKESKKRGADILYCTTVSPDFIRIAERLKFVKLDAQVFYKDFLTGKIKKERNVVLVFEHKKGIVNKILEVPKFNIGIGPI